MGPLLNQGIWQFIYRLLPCFVASYVDLTNDSKVTDKAKKFYFQFISLLINDYFKNLNLLVDADVSISYLKWKFDCVASELKMQLYGATDEPPTVTRQLQEKCFDVLTDCLGKVDEKICGSLYQKWMILLDDFSERMHRSLLQLTKLPVGFTRPMVEIQNQENHSNTMSTLCRMLAAGVFQKQGLSDNPEFSDSRVLLCSIFSAYVKTNRLKILKLRSRASKCKTWSAVLLTVKMESEKLSENQCLGLALFLCLSSNHLATAFNECINSPQKKSLRFLKYANLLGLLYYQIICEQISVAAEKIPVFFNLELSQVSLQFAKDTAPTCYSPVLDRVVDGKVKMDAPGQNTFCPVPHCRWCGLVKNPSEMLVCQFCTDKPKYPDTHLFCSSQCEDLAMKDQHGERHAEFIEYGLGLKKVNPFINVPLISPNCIMFKCN
jgi:hypothetical protein